MSEDYIEKISPQGFVIRVNFRKGTFMVFKDNEPLKNPRSKTESIVHSLPQVIFLGKEFDVRTSLMERVGFFDALGGQVHIPFWVKGSSDIRHVKLPAHLNTDLLPVYVYHFQAYHLGSIPASISGMNYFVVESRIDREMLIRLKMHFPMSRVIIYRGEKDSLIQDEFLSGATAKNSQIRATDMLESDDLSYLSQNPGFAARVYLRRLDFERVRSMPLRFAMSVGDIDIILTHLEIMKKKSTSQAELRNVIQNIEGLTQLFSILRQLFNGDVKQAQKLISENGIPSDIIDNIRVIVDSQISISNTNGDPKRADYFNEIRDSLAKI